jgi:predicted PurR-regulated permease PerM
MGRSPDVLTRLGRFLAFCVAGIILLWFLYKIRLVLLLLVGSAALAYALDPLVHIFSRGKRELRPLGMALAYLTLFAGFALVAFASVGSLISEAPALGAALPNYAQRIQIWATQAVGNARASLPESARTQLDQAFADAGAAVRAVGGTLAQRSFGVVASASTLATEAVLMLVMSALMLADKDYFKNRFFLLVPAAYQADAASLLSQIDAVLAGYVRGQIVIAVGVGVLATLGMQILGVRYAVILGLFTAVTQLIPNIGGLLGMIPAVILAAFQSPWLALEVLIFFIGLYTLSGNVLGPWVMGRAVQINSLVIIVATIAGAILGGIIGILLSVPVVAVLKVILDFAYRRLGPRLGLGLPPDAAAIPLLGSNPQAVPSARASSTRPEATRLGGAGDEDPVR